MSARPEIVVDRGADELAADVAEQLLHTLTTALAERTVAHLVLTGGGILEQVMSAVRQRADRASVDWARVHIWWGDERYVSADSDDRNDKAAFGRLLEALPLDSEHIHRMPSADEGFSDVDAAAASYAGTLAAAADGADVPRFDVVLLGIGPDGHCASLFPGHAGVQVEDAAVIGVSDSPKPPPVRISLTFRGLDAAEQMWVIASGEAKAHAVARALGGADPIQVPSARARGRLRTVWFIDAAAAQELPPGVP